MSAFHLLGLSAFTAIIGTARSSLHNPLCMQGCRGQVCRSLYKTGPRRTHNEIGDKAILSNNEPPSGG